MARLLSLVAVASTLILGGCVAESGEEQEITAAERPAAQTQPLPIATSAGTIGVHVAVTPTRVVDPAAAAAAAPIDPSVTESVPVDTMDEDDGDGAFHVDPVPQPWHGDPH